MNQLPVVSYSKMSKWLHWIVAVIVLLMLSGSFFLDDVPERFQATAYMIHKSMGLTVLFLMLLRFLWIIHKGKPALPSSIPAWERGLSRIIQYSLYVFLIMMPVCGWVMSVAENRIPVYFGLLKLPLYGVPVDKALSKFMGQSHTAIAWILIGLITLHIAGALKHYFIDKDDIMKRMLRDYPRKNL